MNLRNRALLRTGAAVAGFVVASSAFAATGIRRHDRGSRQSRSTAGTISVDSDVQGHRGVPSPTPARATPPTSWWCSTSAAFSRTRSAFRAKAVTPSTRTGTSSAASRATRSPSASTSTGSFELSKVPGATGPAGSITASIFARRRRQQPREQLLHPRGDASASRVSTSGSGPRTCTGGTTTAKFFTEEPIAPGGDVAGLRRGRSTTAGRPRRASRSTCGCRRTRP